MPKKRKSGRSYRYLSTHDKAVLFASKHHRVGSDAFLRAYSKKLTMLRRRRRRYSKKVARVMRRNRIYVMGKWVDAP